jgi:DNA-binding response OmpR family regulator
MTADSPRHVLIVDDEQPVADTLSLVFQSKGYSVTVAYNAESALVLSQTLPPDIVISDIMLPGMNGIQFAILMHETYPNCRVILLSGHPATADVIVDAEAHGHIFELLPKPYHPSELLARVSAVPIPTNQSD